MQNKTDNRMRLLLMLDCLAAQLHTRSQSTQPDTSKSHRTRRSSLCTSSILCGTQTAYWQGKTCHRPHTTGKVQPLTVLVVLCRCFSRCLPGNPMIRHIYRSTGCSAYIRLCIQSSYSQGKPRSGSHMTYILPCPLFLQHLHFHHRYF